MTARLPRISTATIAALLLSFSCIAGTLALFEVASTPVIGAGIRLV
jgi:hypothetical protein